MKTQTSQVSVYRFLNTWEGIIRDECKKIVEAYTTVAARRTKEIEEVINRTRATTPFKDRKYLLERLEFYQTQLGITRNDEPLDVEHWLEEDDVVRLKTEEDVRRFVRWYHPIILGWKSITSTSHSPR